MQNIHCDEVIVMHQTLLLDDKHCCYMTDNVSGIEVDTDVETSADDTEAESDAAADESGDDFAKYGKKSCIYNYSDVVEDSANLYSDGDTDNELRVYPPKVGTGDVAKVVVSGSEVDEPLVTKDVEDYTTDDNDLAGAEMGSLMLSGTWENDGVVINIPK